MFFSFCFCLFRATQWHIKFPRLGAKLELQLPAYTTTTATQDPSLVCNLHHSSRQCRILNPLSEARVEPASSWMLVRFISAVPRREPLFTIFKCRDKIIFFVVIWVRVAKILQKINVLFATYLTVECTVRLIFG